MDDFAGNGELEVAEHGFVVSPACSLLCLFKARFRGADAHLKKISGVTPCGYRMPL